MTSADGKKIAFWYRSIALLIFLLLITSGLIRLAETGLAITEWREFTALLPPVTDAQWLDIYHKFSNSALFNEAIDLQTFKSSFIVAYIHQSLSIIAALTVLLPFIYFIASKSFDKANLFKASLLIVLIAVYITVMWQMNQVELLQPHRIISYQHAAYLVFAVMIFGLSIWFSLDVKSKPFQNARGAKELKVWLSLFLVVLTLQIMYGAFVASLHAGHIYNTFPKMYQFWFPPELWLMQPFTINFFENMVTVQWIHRLLATLLALMAIGMWIRSYQTDTTFYTKKWILAVFALILAQYMIGVFTLVYHVPVWLGVLHQAMAMVLFGVVIAAIHRFKFVG